MKQLASLFVTVITNMSLLYRPRVPESFVGTNAIIYVNRVHSRCSRGLRRGYTAALLLGMRVQIPPGS
jgi:hypothetical protein